MTKQEFLTYEYRNEDQFQALVYRYINHNYPILSMGVLPGCPDLICVKPLFALELKMPNGSQSPAQKQIQELWGNLYHIAYSPKEVIEIMDKIIVANFVLK